MAMNEERVAQCIRRGAITCSEETSLIFVAQIMVVNRIRYCVVTNKNHEVLGLISADRMIDAFGDDFSRKKAKDIVPADTMVTVTSSVPLREAIGLMAKKRVEHLIVVSDRPGSSAVIGIVAAREVVGRMARRQEDGQP
jgi:predicted transcriptional regulator